MQWPVKHLFVLTGIFLSIAIPVVAQSGTADAKTLANSCVACHGPDGSSSGPASPNIAGVSRDYFISIMTAYKNEKIPATIMSRIAKGYSSLEIERLADFFSRKPASLSNQIFDAKKAAKGKKIHKKYCSKCHEDGGSLAADDAGILAGQWGPYLEFTMQDFINEKRPMDKKKKQRITRLMKQQGDKGLEALLHYYMSQ